MNDCCVDSGCRETTLTNEAADCFRYFRSGSLRGTHVSEVRSLACTPVNRDHSSRVDDVACADPGRAPTQRVLIASIGSPDGLSSCLLPRRIFQLGKLAERLALALGVPGRTWRPNGCGQPPSEHWPHGRRTSSRPVRPAADFDAGLCAIHRVLRQAKHTLPTPAFLPRCCAAAQPPVSARTLGRHPLLVGWIVVDRRVDLRFS